MASIVADRLGSIERVNVVVCSARTADEQARLLVKREIAVGATDDEKIACSGAFGKKSKGRRLLRVNLQPVVQDLAPSQFCACIASERVVADAGDDRRSTPQACGCRRYITWRTAQRAPECFDTFECGMRRGAGQIGHQGSEDDDVDIIGR